MKIFSNYHTTFSDGASVSAFALTRVYLGYEYKFSKNFSTKVNLDVANPGSGSLEMTAYVKNAYLRYTADRLSVYFGLIPTTQFKLQEKVWGYRYIEKSFQDASRFNASADLGVSFDYQLTDFLSADLIIANGEGYKKLQSDSTVRTGIGLTFQPSDRFTGRVYYDFSSRESTLSSVATFIGYSEDRFSIGVEYNKQMNHDFNDGHDLDGTSVYTTLKISEKIKLMARYDHLESNTLPETSSGWNLSKDGEMYLAGIEFSPVKGIKIAPNYQGWNPAANNQPCSSTFILNCEIKF